MSPLDVPARRPVPPPRPRSVPTPITDYNHRCGPACSVWVPNHLAHCRGCTERAAA